MIEHHPDCDVNDCPPEGIVKPCNCGAPGRPLVQLGDTDPMPFGKYKGQPMQDVPASYLHWLWTAGKRLDKICPVADYIRRNLSALKTEYEDGIW
jgi:hypothetical protein